MPTALPYAINQLERHPRTAQIFIPLDVSRYVVVVAPPGAGGRPDLSMAMAMIVQGDRGIVFAKGVWHAGATVLDGMGSFAVLHYRDGTPADDELHDLSEPLEIQI